MGVHTELCRMYRKAKVDGREQTWPGSKGFLPSRDATRILTAKEDRAVSLKTENC